jgi:hypothetical protein
MRLSSNAGLMSSPRSFRCLIEAIEGSFGADVDYAMLVKIYGADPTGEKRYSPAECIGAVKHRVEGNPDPKHVSTSFAERQNLILRMQSRRFTRLTMPFQRSLKITLFRSRCIICTKTLSHPQNA